MSHPDSLHYNVFKRLRDVAKGQHVMRVTKSHDLVFTIKCVKVLYAVCAMQPQLILDSVGVL